MRPPWVVPVAGLLALIAAALPLAAGVSSAKPRIEELVLGRKGSGVQVSFRLAEGLAEDTVERIHSSIPVTFRHRVELVNRRAVPLWPAKVLAVARVDTSVDYDSLTRRYTLSRRSVVQPLDGGVDPELDEQRLTTASIDVVRSWMTELRQIPELPLARGKDQRLRVRVESALGRRYVWFLIPTRLTVSAERRLDP